MVISRGGVSFLLIMVLFGMLAGCRFAEFAEYDLLPAALKHLNKGVRFQKGGMFEEAIEEYTLAIQIDTGLTEAYLGRAGALSALGEFEEAIPDFTRVIDIDPERFDAYYGRGIANTEIGNFESALSDFNKAIDIDPFSVSAFLNRANLKIQTEDLEGAFSDCTKAVTIDPENAVAFFNRGIVRERKKDYALAVQDYETAASLSAELASEAAKRIRSCRNRLRRKILIPSTNAGESARQAKKNKRLASNQPKFHYFLILDKDCKYKG